MSSSASATSVSDRPIAPYVPEPPKSKFSKRYLKLTGDEDRAQRLDYCGRLRFKQDVNLHTKHEYQHCMDRWCAKCALDLRKSTIGRWEETVEAYDLPGSHFTFVEASIPHTERSLASVQADFERLKDVLDGFEPYWVYSPGYSGNRLTLRVLYLGDGFSESDWRRMFPEDAVVQVTRYRAHQLRWGFEHRLLALALPRDPYDRAEQSAMFVSVRLFRSEGLEISPSWEHPSPGDLFAETNLPANISAEMQFELDNTPLPLPDEHDRCSICGEKFIRESQWFLPNDPAPHPDDLVWFPRGPSS